MSKTITKEQHDDWVAKILEESPDHVILRESPANDVKRTEELLGIKEGTLPKFNLRFAKGGELCTKCGRHFSVLDLFNTALEVHSKEFLVGVLNDTEFTHSDTARFPNCYECGEIGTRPTNYSSTRYSCYGV